MELAAVGTSCLLRPTAREGEVRAAGHANGGSIGSGSLQQACAMHVFGVVVSDSDESPIGRASAAL